jgi:hypothetical protein
MDLQNFEESARRAARLLKSTIFNSHERMRRRFDHRTREGVCYGVAWCYAAFFCNHSHYGIRCSADVRMSLAKTPVIARRDALRGRKALT